MTRMAHAARSAARLTFLVALSVQLTAVPGGAQQAVTTPHGALPDGLDCSACHTARGWNTLRQPLGFQHKGSTAALITGAHAQASCAGCHAELRFDGPDVAMSECASCHADVHQGRMVQACTTCHNTSSFHDVDGELIHSRTSFPLTGAHRQVTCESCHVSDQGGAYSARDTECSSCHMGDYDTAVSVDHLGLGYPTSCVECHSTISWNDTPAFDHLTLSRGFELLGAHNFLRCASCHVVPGMELLFSPADQNDCVACHQRQYDREHGGSRIPTTCQSCHTLDSWHDPHFDHAVTGFELLGRHARVECSACHQGTQGPLKFPAPAQQSDCLACHKGDYDEEHTGSGFPTTCLACHNQDRWEGARFDHGITAFPLMGAHASAECKDCHGPPAHLSSGFKGAEECVACHQVDYDKEHTGSGFPTTCLACHNQASWGDGVFDHVKLSNGYPLDGPHKTATCASCHTLPTYGLKFTKPSSATDCVACHQADYDAHHAGSNFPTTCLSCHAPDKWTGAVFDHAGLAGYALVEAHAAAPCASCHTIPGYALKFAKPASRDDCVACHQTDYDGHHTGSSFPTTCLNCHSQTTWQGAKFDHGASTGFALEGPHTPLQCVSCHAVPGYALLFPKPGNQDDCVACHQGDYDANHGASGFPTTCLTCHARTAWKPATVDHVTIGKGFQLLGAHSVASCSACHSMPSYALLFPTPAGQNDCYACHQANYATAHAAQGYRTTCAGCHTVTAWSPSTFNHDTQAFPIYTGKHREAWTSCAQCHTVPSNILVFSCLTCHVHSQTAMDDKHKGRQGYAYDSNACLSCHPTGRAG